MIPVGSARRLRKALAVALAIAVLGLWFDAAYEQQALYTSNQNTYLVHGLALAGRGLLHEDWFARTLDPTPAFSRIVALSYRFLPEKAFYFEHAILAGVYLFSLIGLAWEWHRRQARIAPGRARSGALALAAMLVALHSGSGERLWSIGNQPWTLHLHEGMASQDILARIYQPGTFGVLLILSLWLFLRGRALAASAAAALAATMHPTYLLSAAALNLGYLLVLARRGNLRGAARLAVGSAALVLPIALYALVTFRATSPAIQAEAYKVLVHGRIPHHALPERWLVTGSYVRLGIVAAALVAVRRSPLFPILLVPFLVSLGLTLVQIFAPHDALALLFPWRLSAFLVPIGTTLLFSTVAFRLTAHRFGRAAALVLVAAAAVPTLAGAKAWETIWTSHFDSRTTAFVESTRRPGDLYLIPPTNDRLRILLGAPVLVDHKSHPYKDAEVLEWDRRNQLARRFYVGAGSCPALGQIALAYPLTHVVAPSSYDVCGGWRRVFDDRGYAVWKRGR